MSDRYKSLIEQNDSWIKKYFDRLDSFWRTRHVPIKNISWYTRNLFNNYNISYSTVDTVTLQNFSVDTTPHFCVRTWISNAICHGLFLYSMVWGEMWLFILLILRELLTITNSIQHYVITFVSDLQPVGGFLQVLWFPPPIKLTTMI
jgi:hypothetical protein